MKELAYLLKQIINNIVVYAQVNVEERESLNRGGQYFKISTAYLEVYLMHYNFETMEEESEIYAFVLTIDINSKDEIDLATIQEQLIMKGVDCSLEHER